MTGTGGLAVTAETGGGPGLDPGPETEETGATAGTEGPLGGRGVPPETVEDQDPRAAADLAD